MELEDRDPNNLSRHLQVIQNFFKLQILTKLKVSWEDVFGEPDSIRSPECAWSVSNQCFRLSKNFCYICLSVVCAPISAFCLGITFACISFEVGNTVTIYPKTKLAILAHMVLESLFKNLENLMCSNENVYHSFCLCCYHPLYKCMRLLLVGN